MLISNDWKDYELLECGNGEKLERWGNIFLVRPDPQIIWNNKTVNYNINFGNEVQTYKKLEGYTKLETI